MLSLNIGSGKSKSVQYYEDIIDSDIIQSSNNNYINIGYRPALDLELKLSHIKNTRAFKNYYSLDSSNSNNEISTIKIEKSSKKYGSIELYFSDQISSGKIKYQYSDLIEMIKDYLLDYITNIITIMYFLGLTLNIQRRVLTGNKMAMNYLLIARI